MLGLYLVLIDGEDSKIVFERLYNGHCRKMMQIARKILKDEGLAEDAVHDTFVCVARHINKHPEQKIRSLKFYMYVSVKYKALTYLKRMKKEMPIEDAKLEARLDVEAVQLHAVASKITDDMMVKVILEEIANLKTTDGEILTLRYINKMNSQEIANLLNLSNDAVRKRLERARKRLVQVCRKKVGDYDA